MSDELPFRFHPDASDDAEAAVAWYRKRSPSAARHFIEELDTEELDTALRSIRDEPRRWPKVEGEIRRFIMRRFPYLLIYRVMHDRLDVLAVAHAKRRPGY